VFAGELRKQKALFAVTDGAALAAAFSLALLLHDPAGSIAERLESLSPSLLALGTGAVVALWILVFRGFDLYRMRNGGSSEYIAIVKACSIAGILTLLAFFLVHIRVARITVLLAYLLSVPLVVGGRSALRAALRRIYASPRIAIPLVIFGFNQVAHYLLDQVLDGPTQYEPVGFLDKGAAGRQYRGYPLLGSLDGLAELSQTWPTLEAAIALPDASPDDHVHIIELCEQSHVRWWLVPWIFRALATGCRVDLLGSVPLIGPKGSNIAGLNYVIKRGLDLAAASILLTIATPVVAVAALAIWLADRGPVLFRQTRIGRDGQPFELLKLRTMRRDASDDPHRDYIRHWIRDGAGVNGSQVDHSPRVFKLSDDRRVTTVGRILRRFSIDELPQLINVLRGEMSLIGPRPALPYETELYQEWHRRRLAAAPGITGLWQVSGRNHLSFSDMVRLDVQYLEDWSLLGDLKIMIRTVATMLRGSGL
jgi:exopolysaccharide biosynthesis polyprenyl glycosylphosphotransferase